MKALLSFLVAAQICVASARPNEVSRPQNTLADTVLVDNMLDSMKHWVRAGQHATVIAEVPKLRRLIASMGSGKNDARHDQRELQASKLEGIAHYYAGEYPSALRAFQEFQRVAERIGNPEHIGAAHSYQSYQYREMNEVAHALTSIQRAVDILRTLPPGDDLANALSGLASVQCDRDEFNPAIVNFREAIAIYGRTGNDMNRGSSLLSLADAFMQIEAFDSAATCLTKAIPLVDASGNTQLIMAAHAQQGRALHGLKRYAEAEKELAIAEKLATELESDEALGRVHDIQALIAARNDEPLKALKLLLAGRNALIRDLDLAKVSEITEVRLKAEHEEEQRIAADALADEQQRKRNFFIAAASASIIALLMLILLLTTRRNAARMRQKNEEIIRAQAQLVEAEKQRENEQVRTRIARDIHDDIGSGLTKITLLGNEAKRCAQEHSDDLRATLDRIIGHSREVSAALSDIVWTVDPAHDTTQELVSHARSVAQRLLGGSGTASELRFEHIDPALPVAPGVKHHVVMVMKEAINNALKYAEAKHITVHLEAGAHRVKLVVTDDGNGFDPAASERKGNGLRNMQARADAIGGSLTIESATRQGCHVKLEGPLV
ncbi:MAG: sensor histidine kinase [Flavobacteriales bacterium]|nr:sensor histidine kinase [Flavobacteriales bacterium]